MTEDEFNKLVPILASDGKRMRTPLRVYHMEDRYTVCIAGDQRRIFSSETAPDEIKTAIAMIRAFPPEVRYQRGTAAMMYYVPPDPRLADIGWQLDDYTYIVILEPDLLYALWWPGPFSKDRTTWQTRQNER